MLAYDGSLNVWIKEVVGGLDLGSFVGLQRLICTIMMNEINYKLWIKKFTSTGGLCKPLSSSLISTENVKIKEIYIFF